jgi:hypothetical protein
MKHNAFTEKVEQDKMKLAEAHVAELIKLCDDFDLEARCYTEYRQDVCRLLCKLHEMVASSFGEVKV